MDLQSHSDVHVGSGPAGLSAETLTALHTPYAGSSRAGGCDVERNWGGGKSSCLTRFELP